MPQSRELTFDIKYNSLALGSMYFISIYLGPTVPI